MNKHHGVMFEFLSEGDKYPVHVIVRGNGSVEGWWRISSTVEEVETRLRNEGGWEVGPGDVSPGAWDLIQETVALVSKGEIPCE